MIIENYIQYIFYCVSVYICRGIWTRDIKQSTNISQQILTKILKQLEQRSLLKTVRSVTSKSKKLYMVYDVTPAKELTGGPWYTDQEFDSEFVDSLSSFVIQCVKDNQMDNADSIHEKLKLSGLPKVTLKYNICVWVCAWVGVLYSLVYVCVWLCDIMHLPV